MTPFTIRMARLADLSALGGIDTVVGFTQVATDVAPWEV